MAKWYYEKRYIKVGDIVSIQNHNTMRGYWRMAEVISASPGKDNHVRDVCVWYKNLVKQNL